MDQNNTRSNSCFGVNAGFRADVQGIIVCLHTWKSYATSGIVPRANLPSSPWSLSSLSSLEMMRCLVSRVNSFFVLRSCKGLNWGSGSGGSMVASYRGKTQNRQFWRPENSNKSIQTDTPVFEHIHGSLQVEFILANAMRMTFRWNARIFSIEGQRGPTKSGRRE